MKRIALTGALVAAVLLTAAQPAAASWLQKPTPPPSGATIWSLSAVSCPLGTWCMAVGATDSHLLAETRTNGTWTIVTIPDPGGGQLAGLSCTSPTFCEAVGSSSSGGVTEILAETWNGSSWSIQSTPNPSGADNSQLNGVSCPAGSACEAVGSSNTGPNFATLAEVWNGSTWKIQTTPNLGGSSVSELDAVSCTAASACTATGTGLAE